jgi:hypothetical protein
MSHHHWHGGKQGTCANASIAVVIGLYGETKTEIWAPPTSRIKLWHKIFIGLVTIGVAGELLADGDIFLFSHRLQSIQELEVARLNDRAADAEKGAAAANERAAKAELELAKLKSPRTIKPEQANNLIAHLSLYRGKRVWIIIDKSEIDVGSEQETLGRQLTEIFLQAQWIKDSHTMKDRSKIDPESTPVSNRGCVVSTADDSSSVNLAKVVLDGLKSAGVECGAPGPFPEMASEMVAIEIGLR